MIKKVLLWVFLFPIMLLIAVLKSTEINKGIKFGLATLFILGAIISSLGYKNVGDSLIELFSIGLLLCGLYVLYKTLKKPKVEVKTEKETTKEIEKITRPTSDESVYGIRKTIKCNDVPTKFVLVDLETTGLNPNTDKIIEVGIIKYENGEVVDTYNTLIDPKIPIPPGATKIHGITNKMVKGQPTIEEVIHDIYKLIDQEVVVGYNVKFDISFISKALVDNKLIIEQLEVYDVLDLVRSTLSHYNLPNKKLDTIKEFFKIETTGHRALSDCEATLEILKILKLKNREEQKERILDLNDNEKYFIEQLTIQLDGASIDINRLNYNILSDRTINFKLDGMQIGRVKLRGRKYRMQLLDSNNVFWLDIENIDEAINNIKYWIKYCKELLSKYSYLGSN